MNQSKKAPVNPNELARSRALRLIALNRRRKADTRFQGALMKAQHPSEEIRPAR